MRDTSLNVHPKYKYKKGFHFTRSLAEKATQDMKNEGKKVLSVDEALQKLTAHNIALNEANKFDAVVSFNEMMASYYPNSMRDEACLINGVKAVLERESKYPGSILMHWLLDYAIQKGKLDFLQYLDK